jgi:hypothetical protein
MKMLITLSLLLIGLNLCAQYEIRGADYICTNTPQNFQLYFNGSPNSRPVVWSFSVVNPLNQIEITNPSNSSATYNLLNIPQGCGPYLYPGVACCYPPSMNIIIKDAVTLNVLHSEGLIFLGCTYPIFGPNSLPMFSSATYNLLATVGNAARNCFTPPDNTVWVVSENLQIVNLDFINSNKITVRRIGPGTAHLELWLSDGHGYTKRIIE